MMGRWLPILRRAWPATARARIATVEFLNVYGSLGGSCTAELMLMLVAPLWPRLRWRRLNQPVVLRSAGFILASRYYPTSLAIVGTISLPPPNYFFPSTSCHPCPPFHIRHMATLGLMLEQLRTCTRRTILLLNFPSLILLQPPLGSTSLLQAPSHAPLVPPPARPKYSLERVSSTGRHFPAGASGYVGSGYVRSVSQFILLLIF